MDIINLELERQKIKKRLDFITALFAIIFSLSLILVFLNKNVNSLNFLICFITFLITIYGLYRGFLTKEFNLKFKDLVISKIIKEIDENLSYNKNGFLSKSEFLSTKIYDNNLHKFSGNDLISGRVDGVMIKFSDIKATKIFYNGEKEQEKSVFYGIFFIAEFNKNIKSQTYIIDKKSLNSQKIGTRAYMDDSEFEQIFDVFCFDQINARYLLTPKFMQDFTKMRKNFKCPINACLMNRQIFIYIERGFDSFEPNLKEPLAGKGKNLQIYADELKSCLDLVKTLNLNNDLFKS